VFIRYIFDETNAFVVKIKEFNCHPLVKSFGESLFLDLIASMCGIGKTTRWIGVNIFWCNRYDVNLFHSTFAFLKIDGKLGGILI
jgi:hypothetical protein